MTTIDLNSSLALAQALDNFAKTAEHGPAQMDMGDVMAEFAVALSKYAAGFNFKNIAKFQLPSFAASAEHVLGSTGRAGAEAAAHGMGQAAGRGARAGAMGGRGPMAGIGRQAAAPAGFMDRMQNAAGRIPDYAEKAKNTVMDTLFGTNRQPLVDPATGLAGLFEKGKPLGEGGWIKQILSGEKGILGGPGSAVTAEQAKIKELSEQLALAKHLGAGAGGMFLLDRALGGGGGNQPPSIVNYR